MPALQIVDAHHHLWRLADGHCAEWLPQEPAALQRDFLPEALEATIGGTGVEGTILVQAARSVAETEWLLDIADRTPLIRGVVGWVDPLSANAVATVERWRARKLLGIRLWNQADPDCATIDAYSDAPLLGHFGEALPFDLLVFPRHLPGVLRLILRHPHTRFVIDHAAKPNIADWRPGDADFGEWARLLREIAAAGAFCKLSGLVTEARSEWSAADLRPYCEMLLDIFSSRRLIWGSDWPVALKASGYRVWLETAQALTAALSPEIRGRIFRDNALDFYRVRQVGPA